MAQSFPLRVGVLILLEHPWRESRARWQRAEQLGFAHAWTDDHLTLRGHRDLPWFTAIPTLTGAALVTVRIRLGTLVASPNFRHPLTLAEEIVTLDDISSGRVTLGIGQGSTGWDAAMLGAPPWSPRERSEPFREFVELTDMLLREPETNYVGSFYSVRDARTYPGCVQRPRVPVAIAAGAHEALVHGERGLDQRGVHPEHQLGVRGCIGSSGREATELHVDPPWTPACTACTASAARSASCFVPYVIR